LQPGLQNLNPFNVGRRFALHRFVSTKTTTRKKTTTVRTIATPVKTGRAKMLAVDPFDMLKRDHQKVKSLFRDAEDLGDRATKKLGDLYAEIKQELQVHAKIEEAVLYPALESIRAKETKKLAFEAYEEHAVVKMMLLELDRAGTKDERFKAKLKVLKDIVLHHAEEEESEIFPKMRRNLSKEQRATIGTQMLALKSKLLARSGKAFENALAL
jgi:hemerythrin superfamily protein